MNPNQAIEQLVLIYKNLAEIVGTEVTEKPNTEEVGQLCQIANAALAIATKCNARIDWVAGNGDVKAL